MWDDVVVDDEEADSLVDVAVKFDGGVVDATMAEAPDEVEVEFSGFIFCSSPWFSPDCPPDVKVLCFSASGVEVAV